MIDLVGFLVALLSLVWLGLVEMFWPGLLAAALLSGFGIWHARRHSRTLGTCLREAAWLLVFPLGVAALFYLGSRLSSIPGVKVRWYLVAERSILGVCLALIPALGWFCYRQRATLPFALGLGLGALTLTLCTAAMSVMILDF